MTKRKVIALSISAVFTIFIIASLTYIKILTLPPSQSLFPTKNKVALREVQLTIPKGMTARALSQALYSERMIKSPTLFYLCARGGTLQKLFVGTSSSFVLHAGRYTINNQMSLRRVYEVFSNNEQDVIKLVVSEGFTMKKIAARLEALGVCTASDFLSACANEALLKKYSIPSQTVEGYLFPDTYYLDPVMDAQKIVQTMVDNFFSKLNTLKAELNLSDTMSADTLNDNVILASIVEREYRIANEAPIIASVFRNRLTYDIGLYSCATIEYIITDILGKPHPDTIKYSDLQLDSPYNTYKWRGLPPTAISNPGIIALKAAFATPKTNYYYFRLVDSAKGEHAFSQDFGTHISEGWRHSTKSTLK